MEACFEALNSQSKTSIPIKVGSSQAGQDDLLICMSDIFKNLQSFSESSCDKIFSRIAWMQNSTVFKNPLIEKALNLGMISIVLCEVVGLIPRVENDTIEKLQNDVLKHFQVIALTLQNSSKQKQQQLIKKLLQSIEGFLGKLRIYLGFFANACRNLSPGVVLTIFTVIEMLSIFQQIPFELAYIGISNLRKEAQILTKICFFPSVQSFFTFRQAPFLPAYSHKNITLVLDLDETLGHTENGIFYKRPGVEEFISELDKFYELVLFTASSQDYADSAIKQIDPSNKIKLRLYRQHTGAFNSPYVKNLELLGRDLSKVIIIDDWPTSFSMHPNNGILISPFTGDESDCELKTLLPILINLAVSGVEDVREALKSHVKM